MAGFGLDGPPETAGIALGRAIQRARKARGFRSQDAFAKETGEGISVIAKAESGTRVPTKEVFAAIMGVLDVGGEHRQILEDLWWLARKQENPVEARTAPYYATEARAHTLRYWAPLLIPGSVQTADYARAIYEAWRHAPDTVDELVAARMERQSVLGPDGPDVTIVLWEPVLHNLIGSPDVMRGQIARLLDLYERRNMHIHVLPSRMGANMGLGGAIHLATTDEDEVLMIEGFSEDIVTSDRARVRAAAASFNGVRSDALNREDSRAVLSEAVEKWNK